MQKKRQEQSFQGGVPPLGRLRDQFRPGIKSRAVVVASAGLPGGSTGAAGIEPASIGLVLAAFFAAFFLTAMRGLPATFFLAGAFLTAFFLAGAFLAAFLAPFLADFLVAAFLAPLASDFFWGAFLAAFFAAFFFAISNRPCCVMSRASRSETPFGLVVEGMASTGGNIRLCAARVV